MGKGPSSQRKSGTDQVAALKALVHPGPSCSRVLMLQLISKFLISFFYLCLIYSIYVLVLIYSIYVLVLYVCNLCLDSLLGSLQYKTLSPSQ